jgi:hypothetical protein
VAFIVDASGEGGSRTASLPSTSAFTACGWVKTTERASQNQFIFAIEDASSWMSLGYGNSASTVLQIDSDAGTPDIGGGGYNGHGAWMFWALKRGVSGTLYAYAYRPGTDSVFATASIAESSWTPTAMYLGTDSLNNWSNSVHAGVRVWDAELTEAELYQEMWSLRPRRWSGLHLWSPLFTALTDISGAGRTWTSLGTATYSSDGPPVGWGAAPLVVSESALTWYPQDGTAPWSSIWRPARV